MKCLRDVQGDWELIVLKYHDDKFEVDVLYHGTDPDKSSVKDLPFKSIVEVMQFLTKKWPNKDIDYSELNV